MAHDDASREASSGSDSAARERLVDLVTECLILLEDSGPDEAAERAALDRFCETHPAEGPLIRQRIRLLRGVGALENPTPDAAQDDEPFPTLERLGDFRLVRLLATGGMGVIYVAIQESLGREVALKLIRPDHLYFPATRERFRREVEAVARMQHPAIVPVHTVGEAQGIPYFAMELVRGASAGDLLSVLRSQDPETRTGEGLFRALAVKARERGETRIPAEPPPLFQGGWVETCLRIVLAMLSGLDHAHRRGVLHRDLKPSNLMITPDGRVLLLDFGLAASNAPGHRATATVGLIGSIPYMAPEQLGGAQARVDERTDVYGAGVTLYELLTARSPFLEESAASTQQRIFRGEFTAPRKLNRTIGSDAEVVLQKAMALDPADRYVSVSAFASDVENLLAGRPVNARPISAPRRFWRLARRNRVTTTACAIAAALVVVAPTVLFLQERRASQRLIIALDDADSERGRAERTLLLSLRAVREMIDSVGLRQAAASPELKPVRMAVIERGLALYQSVLADHAGNPALRSELASTQRRAGNFLVLLGRHEEGAAALEKSTAMFDELRRAFPDDPKRWAEVVLSDADLGAALWALGRHEEAMAVDRRGVATADAIAAMPHGTGFGETQLTAARMQNNLSLALNALSRPEEGLAALIDSEQRLERLIATNPGAPQVLRALIEARVNVEYIKDATSAPMDPAPKEETIRLAREYAALDPSDVSREELLATVLTNLNSDLELGSPRAIDSLREATALCESLESRSLDPAKIRSNLASGLLNLRSHLVAAGDLDEALKVAGRTIEAFERAGPGVQLNELQLAALAHSMFWVASLVIVAPDPRSDWMDRAVMLAETSIAARPAETGLLRYRDRCLAARLTLHLNRGEHAVVERELADLLAITTDKREWLVRGAKTYAVNLKSIREDTELDDAARDSALARNVEAAIACLREATEKDYVTRAELEGEALYEPLRADPRFAEVLAIRKD